MRARRRLAALVLAGAAMLAPVMGPNNGHVSALPFPEFGPSAALAASPAPTPAIGGDPRSKGEGPGLVGRPLEAVLGVFAVGLLALLGTTAYVRLTGGRRRR